MCRRFAAVAICMYDLLGLSACGGAETSETVTTPTADISAPQVSDSSGQPQQTDLAEAPVSGSHPEELGHKILIAYFTWAENTVAADLSPVDIDATTSASVLAPGHVAQMASWIQSETGGDLFSIVTEESYSSDYDECLDRAADEKADEARPALTNTVSNMADYDVVFLVYPDWW